MPKQQGPHPITGSMDDLSYYKHKDHGFLIRRKGGPSKEKIKNDPAFERTRENNSEFGRASHYGKLLRRAFQPIIDRCKSSTMNTNLCRRLREIIRMDPQSGRGDRDLRRDTLSAFTHFELDEKSLSSRFFVLPVSTFKAGGLLETTVEVTISSIPRNAAAWRIPAMLATIDLLDGSSSRDVKQSSLHPAEKGNYVLAFSHPYDEGALVFHGLCIEWYRFDHIINDHRLFETAHVNAGFIRYVGD